MRSTISFRSFLFVSILMLPIILSGIAPAHSAVSAPLLSYQTQGPTATLSLQRISDGSFETGTSPWTELDYNNYTPGLQTVQTVTPGYNDNSALQLTVNSGNLTTYSQVTLFQDFSKSPVAFGNSLTLRASVQTPTIQGTTANDRVEISVTLVTSIGNTTRIHYVFATGSSLPTNKTSDVYLMATGTSSNGWTAFARNIATDAEASFPSISSSFTVVKDVRLSVYSASQSTPTHDPRIRYIETGTDSFWNTTGSGTGTTNEAVVFDSDADGVYNAATDPILFSGTITPSNGTRLSNDPWIKYIYTNQNGHWDYGEAIVYDWHHDGVYDLSGIPSDPIICDKPPYCGPAIVGSLLQDPVRKQTRALFDQVELYSPAGNYNPVLNGGFETGNLAGWGNVAGFSTVTTPTHSGLYSAFGIASGTTIDLAQSLDAKPVIDSSTSLQASAYVSGMTGGSTTDKVDVWLGLVDSSPNANPLSIYYYFKTGTSNVPSNTTDTLTHKVPGFGALTQWLSLNQNLLPETTYFNSSGYTAPYRIETIVLEASAQTSATTASYFDDIAIPTIYKPNPATSNYYATDGLNSTYAYTATKVPQGQFFLSVPGQQTLLNITSPAGTTVPQSGYSTQVLSGSLLITLTNSTSFSYPTLSNWHFYATSKNALSSIYATPISSTTTSTAYDPGSKINLVTQTRDPAGNTLSYSNVTIIFYSSNTQAFNGQTNPGGWYNQTLILQQNAGTNNVEAITVSNSYIGLRTLQLTINPTTPWALIIYATIAAGAIAVLGFLLWRRRRKQKTLAATPVSQPPTKTSSKPGPNKKPARK